jgi:hypothetical protein
VKLQNLVIVWDGRKLPLHGGGFSGTWFCNLVEGFILGLDEGGGGGRGGLLQKADGTITKNKPSFLVLFKCMVYW